MSMHHHVRFGALAFVLCVVATPAVAQWSHDPATNFGIRTGGSDQNQAKVLPTSDGGVAIAWLDGIGTGWDTRVQRLGATGLRQWSTDGVLVADTSFSSTQDYGFAIDATDHTYVAYRDDTGGPVQIRVQKIDPSGTLLWGPGTQVSVAAGGSAPHCCATGDGGAIVTWTTSTGAAAVQKVDSSGAIQWASGGVSDVPPGGIYFVSDIVSDEAGGALVLYHHQTGGFSSPRHLKMQRFASADGSKLWNGGTPLTVFDAGSIQLGTFPALVSDGDGGALVAWYNTGGTRNAYMQHIDVDGGAAFAANGVAIGVDVPNRIRISATVAYDAASGEIFMAATESAAAPQGNYTVIVQRFDARGVRQWGAAGTALIPQGADQPSSPQVRPTGDGGAIFAWANGGFNDQSVFAVGLDAAGAVDWPGGVIEASTVSSGKARLGSTTTTEGAVILTWGDNRDDANDIYGQRVNPGGTLGTPGDVNDDGVVNPEDLAALLAAWGRCPRGNSFCAPDLDGDGMIGASDLAIVLANWS